MRMPDKVEVEVPSGDAVPSPSGFAIRSVAEEGDTLRVLKSPIASPMEMID